MQLIKSLTVLEVSSWTEVIYMNIFLLVGTDSTALVNKLKNSWKGHHKMYFPNQLVALSSVFEFVYKCSAIRTYQ